MTALKIIAALAAFAVIVRVGIALIGFIGRKPPEPPPPGELRKINVRYRCSVCGMEMRIVLAADEQPEPPRHCMEEMDLVLTE